MYGWMGGFISLQINLNLSLIGINKTITVRLYVGCSMGGKMHKAEL